MSTERDMATRIECDIQDLQNTNRTCFDDSQKPLETPEFCAKGGQPYIPYELAKLYITKIVEDMQQMKLRYKKIIEELELINEDQERDMMVLRSHYSSKMDILQSKVKAYQEQIDNKNSYLEGIIKSLQEENRDLMKDKVGLLHQVKELQEKLEKEKLTGEMENQEALMQNTNLVKAHITLEKVIKSMHQKEKDMSELLQYESTCNRGPNPQITVNTLLQTALRKIHLMYCEVPEEQQFVNHLFKKNDAEIADWKKTFNKTIAGNILLDHDRSLVNTKNDLESTEYEKLVLDCIRTGEIPEWILRNSLYSSITESDCDTKNDQRSNPPENDKEIFKEETQSFLAVSDSAMQMGSSMHKQILWKQHSPNSLTINGKNDDGEWNQQSFDPWIFSKPLFY
uniref:Rho-associated protein kinase 2-like n=1 Tax=Geotrypetes seraphini TaxID=260995 RepID=A0A6P8PZC0_GEOSA|nr:rho-associated protein kinase 2-like [Geotrypetes seraphini]